MYNLYDMFFKRKSFRRFDDTLSIHAEELINIENQLRELTPLLADIKIKYRIVKRAKTSCKRGEYCLLVYSEKKENYLINIGYILEQLDLWMASKDIGACWYGMGKPDEIQYDGLDYVIMLAFGKGHKEEFRKDYKKAKRKDLDIIWRGESIPRVTEAVRYAPRSELEKVLSFDIVKGQAICNYYVSRKKWDNPLIYNGLGTFSLTNQNAIKRTKFRGLTNFIKSL